MRAAWRATEKRMAQARQAFAAAARLGEANCERVIMLTALAGDLQLEGLNLALMSGCDKYLRIDL